MAQITLNCAACGRAFEAKQRNRTTCSKACAQRLRRGTPSADMGEASWLHSCTAPEDGERPSGRVYRLYRGRLDRFDDLTVGEDGRIVSGYLRGAKLREILQTAAREGWLAYRHRPDGWYTAEWANGRIALCGPYARTP